MTPEDRLRELLHATVDDVEPDPRGAGDLRERLIPATDAATGTNRARSLLAAAAAVLFVVGTAGALAIASNDGDDDSHVVSTPSPSTTATADDPTSTSTSTTAAEPATSTTSASPIASARPVPSTTSTTTVTPAQPGSWRTIATAPGAANEAAVWTGAELVVWSGSSRDGTMRGGVAYRPATDTWREFDHGPLAPRAGHTAVWTGHEIVYWGGMEGRGPTFGDGAAFDPAKGRWRQIASSSLSARAGHEVVWTGREMVVWGGFQQCCPIDSTIHDETAAAYNPTTDTWRRLANVPQPWSGDGGPAVTVAYQGDVFVWRRGRLGMLDMDANEWRDLGGPPKRQANCALSGGPLSVGALVGARFYVWNGECSIDHGTVYDIASRAWVELRDPPAGIRQVIAMGGRVAGILEDAITEFDPASGTWSAPVATPDGIRSYPAPVWTGSEVLLWGGYDSSSGNMRRDGAAYRPA